LLKTLLYWAYSDGMMGGTADAESSMVVALQGRLRQLVKQVKVPQSNKPSTYLVTPFTVINTGMEICFWEIFRNKDTPTCMAAEGPFSSLCGGRTGQWLSK
jgi:hypothetical protein